jgi:hypothetical protein
MTTVKEKAESLIEKSILNQGMVEVMAALKIQRVYRGRRYREDLRKHMNSRKVEEGLDVDMEAEKLLRLFCAPAEGLGSEEEAAQEDSVHIHVVVRTAHD